MNKPIEFMEIVKPRYKSAGYQCLSWFAAYAIFMKIFNPQTETSVQIISLIFGGIVLNILKTEIWDRLGPLDSGHNGKTPEERAAEEEAKKKLENEKQGLIEK